MKTTSEFKIKSKLDKRSGLLTVHIYADKKLMLSSVIPDGNTLIQYMPSIMFQNGMIIQSLPTISNMGRQ